MVRVARKSKSIVKGTLILNPLLVAHCFIYTQLFIHKEASDQVLISNVKFTFSDFFYRLTLAGAAVIAALSLITLYDQAHWLIEQFVHFKVQVLLF